MSKKIWGIFASAAASLLITAFSVPVTAGASWTQTGIMGDLNSDGMVNVADLVVLSKHLHGTEVLGDTAVFALTEGTRYTIRLDGKTDTPLRAGETKIQKADMDQNGLVEVFDFVYLRKTVISDIPLGQILCWEDETTTSTTTTNITTTTNTTASQNDFITPPLKNMYGSMPSQGEVNMLIFYVDFPDCKFEYEPSMETVESIAFGEENEKSSAYPFESLTAFCSRASKGALSLSGQAYRYTCKENVEQYHGDVFKSKFTTEVIRSMDKEVDFSKYDSDGDGVIDIMLFCVPDTDDTDEWWPCAGEYSGEALLAPDGVKPGHIITGDAVIEQFDNYDGFVSTFAHEMGHCMGLPDYYPYTSEDCEGLHGSAGYDLMDEAYSDYSAVSKLMLGWLREDQVLIYDETKGEQSFILTNGQSDEGNCLIIPRKHFDGSYKTEFFLLEYLTLDANNSKIAERFFWRPVGSGISVKHVEASVYGTYWGSFFKYESGNDENTKNNEGRRFVRLVNDGDKDNFFKDGYLVSNKYPGFAWYDDDGYETIDPGVVVMIRENDNNTFTVTVTKK